jgi:predicted NBD/HSP70 family sugar kinase
VTRGLPGADVVALDLGGTHVRAARVAPDGSLQGRVRERTVHTERPDQLVRLVRDLAGDGGVGTAVLGLPGRVDRASGSLQHARNLPPSWTGYLRRDWLEEQTGLAVELAGDVELAAVGEAWFGAGVRDGDTVYLSFSTGVGAAATTAGRILAGRRAGFQIGYVRLPGSDLLLDALASGQALRSGEERAPADVGQLLARADAGNAAAQRCWDGIVEHACWTAEFMCHVVVPDVVVVGGGLAAAGDRLLGPLSEAVRQRGTPGGVGVIEVRAAALGDDAALMGAAVWSRAGAPA